MRIQKYLNCCALLVVSACACTTTTTPPPPPPPVVPKVDVFLSDIDQDYRRLQDLQCQAYQYTGSFSPFGPHWEKLATQEDALRAISGIGEKSPADAARAYETLRSLMVSLPQKKLSTRFENPYVYFVAESLNSKILGAIASLKYKNPNVIIGTLPSWDLDARTYTTRSGRRILVFNTGFFNAVDRFCKALLPTIKIADEPPYMPTLDPSWMTAAVAPASNTFIHFVDVPLEYRRLSSGEDYRLPSKYEVLHSMLLTGAELFVVAHEYAHALLGHTSIPTDNSTNALAMATQTREDAAVAVRHWAQELQADRLGLELTLAAIQLEYADGIPPPMLSGPDVALQLLDYLDRAKEGLDTGAFGDISTMGTDSEQALHRASRACARSDTIATCAPPSTIGTSESFSDHPPAALRRQDLITELSRLVGDSEYFDAGSAFHAAIGSMWPNAVTVFKEARKHQQRPAVPPRSIDCSNAGP